MATVFRCHDPNLDRYVAIKVLPSYHTEDPTFVARFSQEAQTVARLSHPNILQIYDFGADKGFTYIVSELVLGGDLQDKLTGESFPLEEVMKYMRPLSEALDYAHGEGIVHRDLKPANVLIDAQDRPILADFGLARMLESATRFTQASQALGTPEYMAPEQAMGANADHRSDLYAFGIMIYQMLLGQTPFRADTPAATLMAHVHRPLPLPTAINPSIEPRLEASLLKALAKDPDDRFQSAKKMIRALTAAAGEEGTAVDEGDLGATAVLDTADIDSAEAIEAATAVMQTKSETGETGLMDAAGRSPTAAPQPAVAKPVSLGIPWWMLAVGGVVAVALVAVAAAILILPGEGPKTTDTQEASPAGAATTLGELEEEAVPETMPTPAMTLSEAVAALEKLTSRAEENVHALRKITPDGEIDTQFRTREQLTSITRGFFRTRETLREQVFEAQELYKVLELMDEDQDLEEVLSEIQLQQVYALFDDEVAVVYVLSDATTIGPLEELGYVSAYMGGLQQQQFDLAKLRTRAREGGSDQLRALDALIGGDVAQVRTGYIGTVFTREQVEELKKPLPENKLLDAPKVVQKAALFPRGRAPISWRSSSGPTTRDGRT